MSLSSYEYSFQTTPIMLRGGYAGAGTLPIVNLLMPQNYPNGVTSASTSQYSMPTFATFKPLPGCTLMENEVATYPVANQTTAANAVITNPLRISLEMLVPANGTITVLNKGPLIGALKATLDIHTAKGGWYDVITPAFVYQGCLLTSLIDASDDDFGKQPQVRWIWNFMQPLINQAAAAASANTATAKMTDQTINAGDPPGAKLIVTSFDNPSANIVQNFVPSTKGALGSNIASSNSSSNFSSLTSISPIAPAGL